MSATTAVAPSSSSSGAQSQYPINPEAALSYVIDAAGRGDLKKLVSIFKWPIGLFERLFPKNGKDNNSVCNTLIALRDKGTEVIGAAVVRSKAESSDGKTDEVNFDEVVNRGIQIKIVTKECATVIDLPEKYWEFAEGYLSDLSLAVHVTDEQQEFSVFDDQDLE